MTDFPSIAFVLTFDRLPLKLLSCYGSELGQTPVLDRLASRGVLADLHFVDDLADYRARHAWWDGASSTCTPRVQPNSTLAGIGVQHGIDCRLISDCQPFSWDIAPNGWKTTYLEPEGTEELSATESFERLRTETERVVVEIKQSQQPAIVWVHSSELPIVPIPSMEFLDLFLDELSSTLVIAAEEVEDFPEEELDDEDSDSEESLEDALDSLTEDDRAAAFELIEETLSMLQDGSAELEAAHIKTLNVLAAARLAECDHCIGRLFELIAEEVYSGRSLFLLTADRGLALGESTLTKRLEAKHLPGPLQEETMHVPLLLIHGKRELGRRIGGLTNHADLPATILDWLGIEHEFPSGRSLLPLMTGDVSELHEQLVCTAGDWRAIRERDWLLIRNRTEGVERLYIKPEDRWQVLDVLSQYIDEADRLMEMLDVGSGEKT